MRKFFVDGERNTSSLFETYFAHFALGSELVFPTEVVFSIARNNFFVSPPPLSSAIDPQLGPFYDTLFRWKK